MKEEEKQRKLHEALLKMLYPPPPTPPPRHEENGRNLIEPSNELPGEELENVERYSSPSSSGNENEGENGGTEKLTRVQRKRLRKRKLKEDAVGRRKIIGPLLPGSSDDENDGGVEVVGKAHEGVRQNAATGVSGDPTSRSKLNKLKRRRKSKSLSGKR